MQTIRKHFPTILALLALQAPLLAREAPHARPFERIDGCRVEPDEWTDGDSFGVPLPDGRLETFRLYFADTTESRSRGQRSDDQAAYFGLTRAVAARLRQGSESVYCGNARAAVHDSSPLAGRLRTVALLRFRLHREWG